MIQEKKTRNVFEEGRVILIDKPLHWTSFDVVRKIRNIIRIKKVGHSGTLDPLASGLLILCTGKFTRKINELMAREKEYVGSFTLGAVTPTYDLESLPEDFRPYDFVTPELLESTASAFRGEIMQVPPAFSAIKQKGKPVYLKARKGLEVKLEPRRILVSEFEITGFLSPEVEFRVVCSTGTYIRSLAHDFGQAIGCGAYLSGLRRTRIGAYKVENAMKMEEAVAKLREEAV